MSRIGKMPIAIPTGVQVKQVGQQITVTGPKGTLSSEFRKEITIFIDGSTITVTRPNDEKLQRSLHGLTRTLINNMVVGVTTGFVKNLEINGVGYRAAKQGKKIVFTLGYSHPVEMEEPSGITIEVPAQNRLQVHGIDKQQVGEVAANIRKLRPPEVYKGKGIKYDYEVIRRKEGKAGGKGKK